MLKCCFSCLTLLLLLMFFCLHLLVSCHSNLGLYLVHSSNGKSVSWSESGARHPPRGGNVWHRLSVHVRKQEAGLNQTAVIRPLTNTPDPHSCEPSTCDLGTDPHLSQEPPGAKPLYNLREEDNEGDIQSPLWTPTCSGQGPESNLDKPASHLPSHFTGRTAASLQGAVVDTHSTHVSALKDYTAREALCTNEPLSLTPSQLPLVPQVGVFEEEGSEDEELDLLHGYIYDAKEEGADGEGEDLIRNKPTLEDSLALSPPSPFRDSVCSGESVSSSPVNESMLGSPPSSVYTSNILRDFAHSSSTLWEQNGRWHSSCQHNCTSHRHVFPHSASQTHANVYRYIIYHTIYLFRFLIYNFGPVICLLEFITLLL